VKNYKYLEALESQVIVFDGAMGTNLQRLNLTASDFGDGSLEGCNEVLVLSKPEVVKSLHSEFIAVGADAIETDTFGAFSVVLSEYKIADKAKEINFQAAKLARQAALDANKDIFVAGSVGPGTKLPSLGQIEFETLLNAYQEQIEALLAGGIDLVLIETVYDLLQAKAAIIAARKAMESQDCFVPIQVQVTIETTGRMLPGTEIGAALCSLYAMKPDVIGLNCATGPQEMVEHVTYLSRYCPVYISVIPNAGLPSVINGQMCYNLSPKELANYHKYFIENLGVNVVGGCCGTTPEHLSEVVKSVKNLVPKKRDIEPHDGLCSLYSFTPYKQEASFLVVGERTNANGSKKFRQAMLSKDLQIMLDMAKEQIAEGAHVIDVCVDYTGENGSENMASFIEQLATASTIPIMLDSTEADVIYQGLKRLGGKPVINSVNLEEGASEGTRLDKFLTLAKTFGAAIVATCIDETGQARTAEHKLKAATSIYELAVNKYGINPKDIFIDPLVLTLATGMEESRKDGIETIKAVSLIKEKLPDVKTIVGLSNVSFGLNPPARQVLNSVFLHELTQAGLDAAIVHAGKILPLNKIDPEAKQVALDLIYDKRSQNYDPLAKLLELFKDKKTVERPQEALSSLPVEKRLEKRIIDGNKTGLIEDLTQALSQGYKPLDIINNFLLEGMKVVGDLFGSGQMQLPFVLQSAETMKQAVSFLEQFMEKSEGTTKGKVVLATVAGDVHDIGKNLVDIILSNNGYEVINLGIKVGINEMLDAVKKYSADALGMSGLLVKSTLVMRDNLIEIQRQNMSHIPVLLGGAALTRRYVEKDLRSIYNGRLFYGKDAFEGLTILNKLMQIKENETTDDSFGREIYQSKVTERKSERLAKIDPATLPKRSPVVETDNYIYKPPFLGTKIAKGIPLEEISKYLNETALYRNQWGYRPLKGESDDEFKTRIRKELRKILKEVQSKDILIPQVIWGYFPVNSDGNDLVIFDPGDHKTEIMRFNFPRQKEEPYLCIADFFRPIELNETDYAAFQIVTMGQKVSEETSRLFKENRYYEYVTLHGLSVEITEALAEYWHFRIRKEWGFADQDGPTLQGLFRQQYRGGRYSWGYPACPNLEDNEKVVKLLQAQRIGVTVTEGFQLNPEQTTLAIVAHHPKAKYFVA
jgi:5-methyltetrahydrofolate--homocysteine methyltransferase